MVINGNTDIDKCINIALKQYFNTSILQYFYNKIKIKSTEIDMKEQPIFSNIDIFKEIDVGSCDRWKLLYNTRKLIIG